MSRCHLIAEIGSNHQGSVETAEEMIRVAADAGFDAVKLQKRHNSALFVPSFYDSPYASENAYGPTYGEHREALELGEMEYLALAAVAEDLGVLFIVTPFDEPSVEFCVGLGDSLHALKVASGSLTYVPLLREVAATGLPVILSTGGGTWEDVDRAVGVLDGTDLTVMQCTASYPARYEELDLGVIPEIARRYPEVWPGASLHDNGIAMAVAAYALGARVIEKHVTLDRTMRGTDHPFSLEPQGQRKLVRDIRRAEVALGQTKRVHDSELPAIRKMGVSPYPVRSVRDGERLSLAFIDYRSPQDGMTPAEFEEACEAGAVAARDIEPWEPIRWESIGDRVLSRR